MASPDLRWLRPDRNSRPDWLDLSHPYGRERALETRSEAGRAGLGDGGGVQQLLGGSTGGAAGSQNSARPKPAEAATWSGRYQRYDDGNLCPWDERADRS